MKHEDLNNSQCELEKAGVEVLEHPKTLLTIIPTPIISENKTNGMLSFLMNGEHYILFFFFFFFFFLGKELIYMVLL